MSGKAKSSNVDADGASVDVASKPPAEDGVIFTESGKTGDIVNEIMTALRTPLVTMADNSAHAVQYGLPASMDPAPTNTISLFLYDVHEDIKIRHGEIPKFNIGKRNFDHGFVWLSYCFLITLWSTPEGAGDRSQGLIRGTEGIINALINLRSLTGVPGSNCRVLPPSEELKSLGTFWQALGNKPRLSLSYMVTAPVPLKTADAGAIGLVRPFEANGT